MYIESFYFKPLDKTNNGLITMDSNRIQYYSDLYARYGACFLIDSQAKVYSYEYLSSILFKAIKAKNMLAAVSWILFPRYGYCWDGAHVSQELYLKNKYGLKNSILDVRDCGSLCLYQSINLAKKLLKNVLVYSIESDFIFNSFPYLGLLKMSTSKNKSIKKHFCILCCDLFYIRNRSDIRKRIQLLLESQEIAIKNVFFIWHAVFRFCFDSGFLYKAISIAYTNKRNKQYFLIVDQEMSSPRAAILLLKLE